jgi:T4-like virus tail tube protein gp19
MSDILQNKLYSVLGDGGRPTKFKLNLMPPRQLMNKYNLKFEDLDILCHATTLPSLSAQITEYKFKGRTIPLPGIQEYNQTWTCTFYNHENHNLRQLMIDWLLSAQTHNYSENLSSLHKIDIDLSMIHLYQVDYEFDKDMVVYTMVNAFPKNISEIELNSESLSQIESFTVEFAYSYFEINKISGVGLTANDIADKIQTGIQKIANNIFKSVSNTIKNKVINPLTDTIANSKVGKFIGESLESFEDFIDS